MQRRNAIKSISLGLGSMVALPSWAMKWEQKSFQNIHFLTINSEATLAEIVETIIPQTDTPGAKALGVDKLIQRIVKDCYEKPAQEQFTQGIALADKVSQSLHNKLFIESSAAQKLQTIQAMAESDDVAQKRFYSSVRQLTIRGYTNSEYYMTKIKPYVMAPGHYYGCVPISK